jgi:hypothetical protein
MSASTDLAAVVTAIESLDTALQAYLVTRDAAITAANSGNPAGRLGVGPNSAKVASNDRLLALAERKALYFHQKHLGPRNDGSAYATDTAAILAEENAMLSLL